MKVSDVIKMEVGLFVQVLKNHVPKDEFNGKKSGGINKWAFGVVMECISTDILTATNKLIYSEFGITQEQLLNFSGVEYVAFMAFVKNELEKVDKLFKTLKGSDNPDAEGLAKFGVTAIYYSVNPNPLVWDDLSKLPFVTMFVKLSIDNEISKIQQKQIENERRRINE